MIRGGLNIYDAFRKYTCTERLGLNDQWYCPSCKSHKQADMKYEIWRLPEILVRPDASRLEDVHLLIPNALDCTPHRSFI